MARLGLASCGLCVPSAGYLPSTGPGSEALCKLAAACPPCRPHSLPGIWVSVPVSSILKTSVGDLAEDRPLRHDVWETVLWEDLFSAQCYLYACLTQHPWLCLLLSEVLGEIQEAYG